MSFTRLSIIGSFNSRLREEATTCVALTFCDEMVSTHASVRRRRLHELRRCTPTRRFQLTPP